MVQDVTKIFHPLSLGRWRNLFRPTPAKQSVIALNHVNLAVARGEIFGLVGRNGQGKTTLIKSIASLLQPTSGAISVLGCDTNTAGQAVKSLIGLVSAEERTFYGRLTGWQNLMFFARLYGMSDLPARRRIRELAEIFDFHAMLSRRFQELSSGNKQRMSLISALLIDPPIILLDEPTRSLDPIAADELRRIIKEELNQGQGKTILITSHNLDEVETLCTRVGFLSRGEIKLCATMEDLIHSYFILERVTLDLRELPLTGAFPRFDFPLPPLEWSRESPELVRVSFRHNVGDEMLHRVIQAILAQGGQIVGCRTERGGLREIMNTIENHDRSLADAAVANGN
jgi:ABC-2 type transport system ATP-binding protein